MDPKTSTLQELSIKISRLPTKTALVGFDGFVDKIVHPVAERYGPGDQFKRIETISEFGQRISAAAGKSANIELYQVMEKLGGNGPIMAKALLSGGVSTRYIGALGTPEVHPVFETFANETKAVSVTGPGITTAAEFLDGKIMFGDMQALDQVTYDNIIKVMGEGPFFDAISRVDLLAMVNWTMLPYLSQLFTDLVEKVFPSLPPREQRLFFFDLADPQKRSKADIAAVLQIIRRFQNHGNVTLGLNLSEAQQVASILGHQIADAEEDGLKKMAMRIRESLDISMVVIHPTQSAACANKDGAWWVEGPYCQKPKITTGAGDHFNAGFMTGMLLELSPEACLHVAVSYSGFYVRTARSPSMSDISSFIEDWKQGKLS